ncbi:alpha/beta hydrolase [Leifsonia shinshuensis]|uniref:Acetyl esterase/lipase n=1 Tax=Leifsonia shinshuensis TaxID=150026 RepID=A0A853CYZ3_9MICO|nr:alpha/beta hydrolase [Leifsonia shinshuensis]NYJ25807.1 acetyl esterase/lipase [Leifsonia shinshuensis]
MNDQLIGPKPALDPELTGPLAALRAAVPGGMPSLSADTLPIVREILPRIPAPARQHFSREGRFAVEEVVAAGAEGQPDVPLLICRPSAGRIRGLVFYIHGGGMVLGSYVDGVDEMLDYAEALGLAVVSVDYRLAPEHPHPAPVTDCYTGLLWTAERASELAHASAPVIIAGESAGGGLAAATTLLARDEQRHVLAGQLLIAPMLDHRSASRSIRLLRDAGMWDRESNMFGWSALLGEGDHDDVSPYASPARATDLAHLPFTYVDVGGADAFRDEAMAYAAQLSEAGNLVDLHVWAGACHGFDGIAPDAAVSKSARASRRAWLSRVLEQAERAAIS